MNLYDILNVKYPTINFLKDVLLQDDGQGAYIKEWNIPDRIKPSQQDLDDWAKDPDVIAEYTRVQNLIKNKPVYDELKQIDMDSIRAIREKDSLKMAYWEQKAVTARSKLIR